MRRRASWGKATIGESIVDGNSPTGQSGIPPLRVQVLTKNTETQTYLFMGSFRIGREEECEVCIRHDYVSRYHVEVTWKDGNWWLRDLKSANGVFQEGRRIDSATVPDRLVIRLGIRGPFVAFEVEEGPKGNRLRLVKSPADEALAEAARRYFGDSEQAGGFSERTVLIRRAFEGVRKKQRLRYWVAIGILMVVAAGLSGYAVFERRRYGQQQATAEGLFYAMKAVEVELANIERIVVVSGSQQQIDQVRKIRQQRLGLEEDYDRYLGTLRVYEKGLSDRDRLILRVTRIFGECELTLPPDYVAEVRRYIGFWQSTDRFSTSISRANQQGYTKRIADEFLRNGLPPQFFYLALQESNFDTYAVGPPTRKGFAKGMWQFIPETGAKYGLAIGPLQDLPRPDPGDERSNWEKATVAAAQYIKDLYATDAQASGLLVMACYNWGENKVLPLVQSMPPVPRERNFWKLLKDHKQKLPGETYNYVFSIISAAVIGEDPRQFGFSFENPLSHLDKPASAR